MRARSLPASIAAGTAVSYSSEAVREVSGAGCSVVESAQHSSASTRLQLKCHAPADSW